jgi:Ca2+-binding EF-hand superfamily protein
MRGNHRRFVEEGCRLLAVAVFVAVAGGGFAAAESDAPSMPLQGPIPFEVFDLDGSGAISEQEFDQVHARRAEAREKAGLPSMRGSRPFSSLDGDGDGEIIRAEFQAAHGAGDPGPGQGPGTRSGGGMGMGSGPPAFSEFDLNGDGAIDEQEFIEARTKRIAERVREGRMMRGLTTPHTFTDLDTDGDGSLTPEEFDTGVRSHRRRMEQGAPPAVEP